jgi:hypothetical protein
MTVGPQREEAGVFQGHRLLDRRVSRRALLTLSLARSAGIAVGPAPRRSGARATTAAAPGRLEPVPCGACGGQHAFASVCPVEMRQRALARGFRPDAPFAADGPEGGS